MPVRETGVQWDKPPTPRPEDMSDEVLTECLTDFWFRLPKTKTLRSQGINRLQHKKSSYYLHQAMNDLVEVSLLTGWEEAERLRRLEKRKQKMRTFVSSQRFLQAEADHPINLQCTDFLATMPITWAKQRQELGPDLMKMVNRRVQALKPKVKSTSDIPNLKSLEVKLAQVRSAHSAICSEALKKTISVDRKKKIRADLTDMDMWNRPIHHLKTPMEDAKGGGDPLQNAETLESMYASVRNQVSQETLNHLLRDKAYDCDDLFEEYRKSQSDIKPPKESRTKLGPKINPKAKANIKPTVVADDRSSVSSASEAPTYAEYGMGPDVSSGFGLHCLRELVKFQDDSWNLQDSDNSSQSGESDKSKINQSPSSASSWSSVSSSRSFE